MFSFLVTFCITDTTDDVEIICCPKSVDYWFNRIYILSYMCLV